MNALPPRANTKLMDLRNEVATHEAVINSLLNRTSDLRKALLNNPVSPNAADWEFEVSRLTAQVGGLRAKSGAASQLLAQIAEWLRTLKPGVRLVESKPVKFKLAEGETYAMAIGRVRQEISDLSTELREVQRSAPTKKELLDAAEKYTDAQVAKVTLKIKATHGKFDVSLWPEGEFIPRLMIPAISAWLNRDSFLRNLQEEINAAPEPEVVMTAEAKAERVSQIRDDLLKNERAEEWIINEAAVDEVHIPRRPMASPLAVLGLAMVTASKEAAAA